MNELWQNINNYDFSDIIRTIGFILAVWTAADMGKIYPLIRDEGTDRLKNLYYGICLADFSFMVGFLEGYLRDRPATFTLYLTLGTTLFIFTGFRTGHPRELFVPGFDSGFHSGYGRDPDDPKHKA